MIRGTSLRTSVAGGIFAGVVLLVGLAPSTLTAQDMDARWLPWLGCWEAVEGGEEAPVLCVRPGIDGAGVEFVTWAQGEFTASETILADGVKRNVEREDCQGLEEARFSDDGHRVYLNSEYVCEGGADRGASGVLAMVNPMEWVDIKAVDGSPWVLRYRLARASKVQGTGMENVVASRASDVKSARIAASARLTEADIIEAVGKVDGAAIEALIVERGDPFSVDADLLVRLDEAGVSEGVIDLVVAISYPERFAVKAGPMPVDEYADDNAPRRRMYMGGSFFNPFYGSGYGYSPFGYNMYGSGYGYGGYGYGGYGYGGYGGYGGYQYAPIVVTPRTGGGRMIKGQGYTPGSSRSGYSGGTARPRSGSSGGGGSAARSGGSSSSGRAAKPRGGGSGGGSTSSSASKARTAKPRGGGGF